METISLATVLVIVLVPVAVFGLACRIGRGIDLALACRDALITQMVFLPPRDPYIWHDISEMIDNA